MNDLDYKNETGGVNNVAELNPSAARIAGLATECFALFVLVPLSLSYVANRWNVHVALWLVALFALYLLKRPPKISWSVLWNGTGWPLPQRRFAVFRFVILSACLILFAHAVAPERLLSFPMQRPLFWLLVMTLYPILSVLPQEFVLRSFFFRRYTPVFGSKWLLISASALAFGFIHIVFHNSVAPLLSTFAGFLIGGSYSVHKSLKWAVVEHAAYGCMVFTVGLGFYFYVGGAHP